MVGVFVRWSGLVVATAVAGAVALLVVELARSPSEHDNPSFRYGEKLMHNYGAFNYAPDSASTKQVCYAAVRRAPSRPSHLDNDEAVRGCLYMEYSLDN